MAKRTIRFGVIGCGLMGREFASAAARWCHLLDLDFAPSIIAASDVDSKALEWFEHNVSTLKLAAADYHELLATGEIEAVYVAVPHNQHEQIYGDTIRAGKHLLGEKPFGIDLPANQMILQTLQENPTVLARCSSEFPFFPGACRIAGWMREN